MRLILVMALFALQQGVGVGVTRLRGAWERHDAAGVVRGGPRVVVQLPGEAPTAPLGPEQAARAVARLFTDATEVDLEVVALREVAGGGAYAELRRRYRVRGAQDVLVQSVFASFRRGEGGAWELVELRVGPPGR